MSYAAIVNQRPNASSQQDQFYAELDSMLFRAQLNATSWPAGDQFPALPSAGPIDGCYGQPAFSFGTGVLCIPLVELPNGTATPDCCVAILTLLDATALSFTLKSATPLGRAAPTAGAVTFDPATGIVTLPSVVLPQTSGTPQVYRARMQLLGSTPTMQFRVIDATLQ